MSNERLFEYPISERFDGSVVAENYWKERSPGSTSDSRVLEYLGASVTRAWRTSAAERRIYVGDVAPRLAVSVLSNLVLSPSQSCLKSLMKWMINIL